MKKTIAMAMLCAMAVVFITCRQGSTPDEGKKMEASRQVIEFLGNDIIDILKNPDRVESYRVKFTKTGKGNNLGGYPVTAKGPDLAPKQVERLQAILLDGNTYLFDVVKKCLFLPEYAFRFVRGEKNVIVLICYSCEELTFVFQGRELLEDFNRATSRLKVLTAELF